VRRSAVRGGRSWRSTACLAPIPGRGSSVHCGGWLRSDVRMPSGCGRLWPAAVPARGPAVVGQFGWEESMFSEREGISEGVERRYSDSSSKWSRLGAGSELARCRRDARLAAVLDDLGLHDVLTARAYPAAELGPIRAGYRAAADPRAHQPSALTPGSPHSVTFGTFGILTAPQLSHHAEVRQ
jgi:hypothetical protein